MRSSRWRKILADLWENRSRTLLVLASIYIGVFAVGMIATGYVILPRGMDSTYSGSIPANIEILATPFDAALVERIAGMEGVEAAQARRQTVVQVRKIGMQSWDDIEISILQDYSDQQVEILTPVSGATLPAADELIMLDETLEILDIEVGERVEIKLSDGSFRRMQVVGSVNDFTLGLASTFGQVRAYASEEALLTLHLPYSFDRLLVAVAADSQSQEAIQDAANRIQHKLERDGRRVLQVETYLTSEHPYGNYINAVIAILALLGVFTVGLSASLIINTMNALVAQQLRQIGVMKLIGANRAQIVGMYFALVAILGLLSFILAVPTSALAGFGITNMVAKALNGRLIEGSMIPIVPFAVVLEGMVALLVPLAAASLPVLRGTSATVQEALSSGLIKSDRRQGWIDRAIFHIRTRRIIRTLALRNTFRNRSRLVLTLLTFALGGGMFIAVINVQGSLDRQIERIIGYSSADVYLETERVYPIIEIEELLSTIDGVVDVEAWALAGGVIELEDGGEVYVRVMAPPDDTRLVDPVTAEGRWVTPEDERALVVNEAFWYTYPDLAPGDTLIMSVNGQRQDWTVVGIFHYSGFDQKLAYASEQALADVINDPAHASSYRIVTSLHSTEFREEMTVRIEQELAHRGLHVAAVTSLSDIIEEPIEKLHIVTQSLMILAVLTGVVGSIGLSGTLGLNVMERTAETGVLRAIGAYDRVIAEQVLTEGLILGVVSNLLGFVLSFPITRVLGDVVNRAIFHAPGIFVLSWKGYVIWSILVVMLSIAASITPVRSAMRLTIREVLAYE
ncbi:MAG: ABC transporter permease [Anaerolineales bacterium]|nr:ABC transporter permease [Anaerolineales bacterium]